MSPAPTAPPPGPGDLYPRPRRVGAADPATRHHHAIRTALDPTLPPQGYVLHVDGHGAQLRHADDAGLRYGLGTAEQLRAADGTLPTVTIEDHPDFATRAYQLDVSRDRVPTRATLDRLVTALEAGRYNQLQLYVEHAFAYREHRVVWADASPVDASDLRWLDDRCAAAGIELVANQNCFGHFGPWLALDEYRWRAECPDGYEVAPGIRLPPGVLAPTPDNADFALALVREQAAAVRSATVNVGCDETFELGMGASRARVEAEGRGSVYVEHLRRILDPLVAEGRTVQYWADVVANHPEHLGEVPRDGAVPLVWNYDAPDAPTVDVPELARQVLDAMGIDVNADTRFARRLRPFADAGLDHWVAPGTSSWNSVVGRLDNALANLRDAAEAGVGSGASGYLVTDWGDGGHHQPLTVSLAPLAYGGAVAWGVDANRDLDPAPIVDAVLLDGGSPGLGAVLDTIGRAASATGLAARNASPLAAGLLSGGFLFYSGDLDADRLLGVLASLDDARGRVERLAPSERFGPELIEELAVAVDLARFGAETLAARAGAPVPPPTARADALDELIARYRAAWLTTSRPGGLAASAAHLARTRDRLRSPR